MAASVRKSIPLIFAGLITGALSLAVVQPARATVKNIPGTTVYIGDDTFACDCTGAGLNCLCGIVEPQPPS
jgi:hypothetical protein